MTKEQFAEMLNGREYGSEITREEAKIAISNGLLVIYGYSDDNVKLRGLLWDEIGAYDGTTFYITENYEIVYKNNNPVEIKAEWSPKDSIASWRMSANIPYATFNILEDNELFCIGIILDKKDIDNKIDEQSIFNFMPNHIQPTIRELLMYHYKNHYTSTDDINKYINQYITDMKKNFKITRK